jgi:hypothetical protein
VGGACSTRREMRNAYKILVIKLETRLRRKWKDKTKIDLKEIV